MERYYKLLLKISIFLLCINSFGQFNISYPSSAEPLTICNGDGLLTVRVSVNTATSNNNIVSIVFPTGVEYVSGTVNVIGGNMDISEYGGTASNPSFLLSTHVASVADYIIFTVKRKATCASNAYLDSNGVFKDKIYVTGTAGSLAEEDLNINSYYVYRPALTLTQPTTQNNAVVGGTYTRTFTITNGASGCANAVHFSITYPGAGIQLVDLSLGATHLTPTSTVGNTSYFTIQGSLLTADTQLCNGESLTFTETYKVKACDAVTNYATGWGCSAAPASWCTTTTGIGNITMAEGVPIFGSFNVVRTGLVDSCTNFNLIVTYKNTGTGNSTAATMYNVKLRLGAGATLALSNFNFSFLRLMSGTIGTLTNIPVTNGQPVSTSIAYIDTTNNALFTSDPDGAGVGLEDVDGDGFYDDLPPGNTVTINYVMSVNCSKYLCNQEHSEYYSLYGDVQHTTMCSSAIETPTRLTTNTFNQQIVTLTNKSYAPSNIPGNTTFRARFSVGYYALNNVLDTSNTRYIYEITLPTGVAMVGTGNISWRNGQYPNNSTSAGTSVTATVSGSVLTIQSPSNAVGWIEIDLTTDCSVITPNAQGVFTTTIPFKFKRLDNIVTGCLCNAEIFCNSLVLQNILCPITCASGGPTTTSSLVERASNSYGWTDNTLSTIQSKSSISTYDLSKALYLDDIEVSSNATQGAASSNLYLHFSIIKHKAPYTENKITPSSINLTIKRGGTVLTSSTLSGTYCTITSGSAGSPVEYYQYLDWNLSSILPPGGLLPNDEIISVATYQVSSNNLATHDIQTGKLMYFYNKDVSNNKLYCNTVVPELYLVSPVITDAHNGGVYLTASSCDVMNVGAGTNYYAYRFDAGGTIFLNEIRPGFLPTQYEITLPSNYELDKVVNPDYGGTLTPASISGNTYTFNLSVKSYPITVTNTYSTIFTVYIKPTCGSIASGENYLSKLYYIPQYYYHKKQASLPTPSTLNKTLSIAYNNDSRPEVSLTNQTGSIQATNTTESFVFRMASIGTTKAPYTWFSIPTVSGVTITQVKDIATGTILTPITYTGGQWYQINGASGLASGSYKDYQVTFTYTTCSATNIVVEGGWNCSAYPATPIDYMCGKSTISVTFTPAVAQVTLVAVTEPTASVNLCSSSLYQVQIGSAGAGNTKSNTAKITLPNGAFITSGTLQAEYPSGSGSWSAVSSTTAGNVVTVNLASHPNYPSSNGIPGVLLSSTSTDRFMNLRWEISTNCDFSSGTRPVISTAANNVCGGTASGSNIDLSLKPINIIGANAPYTTYNTVTTPTLTTCTTTNNTVSFSTIILDGTTTSSEIITITLPLGVSYTTGSFTCSSTLCPTLTSVTTLGDGRQQLLLNMPTGATHGDNLTYSINVGLSGFTATCGANTIELKSYSKFNSTITCPTVPSGTCPSINILTGSKNATITITKPSFTLAIKGYRQNASPNTYQIALTLTNNSTVNHLSGNTLTINYYCSDASGNPTGGVIASSNFSANINAGANYTHNASFTTATCSYANGIVAVLSNTSNCICSTASVRLIPSYLDAINDTFTVNGCTANPSNVTNVLANDLLKGVTPTTSNVTISFVSSSNANIGLSGTNVTVASGTAPGVYTLTYQICEIENPANCDTAVATITVAAAPSVVISSPTTTCNTSIVFTLTGTAPWTVTYTNGTTPVTLSGIASSPYTITVNPSNTTTYTLVSASDAYCNAHSSALTGSATISGTKTWLGTTTAWNNTANWTGGSLPAATDCVIIPTTANNPIVSGSSFVAYAGTLTVQNNATLVVNSGNTLAVTNWVNVATTGTLTLEDKASLVQVNNVANTGNIIYKRNTSITRNDYVYWSSPVASFNVSSITSPLVSGPIYIWNPTVNNPNGGQGNWNESTGATMTVGKGYIVRGPNAFSASTASTLTGIFTGVPNNGTITIPVSRGTDTNTATHYGTNGALITNYDDNHNLIGNPYPSAIKASQFLFDNNATLMGTVKLWTHGTPLSSANPNPFYASFTNNYSYNDYLIYNFTGSSCCPAAGSDLYIGAGQGFFVMMKDGAATTTNVSFNNNQRGVTVTNTTFYKTNQSTNTSSSTDDISNYVNTLERHRMWLDLVDSQGASSRTLVGYVQDASLELDSMFDTPENFDGAFALYSLVGNQSCSIQARPIPFNTNDVVPLGINVLSSGTYTLAIAALDGALADTSQEIYVRDLYTGTVHNLRSNPYTFTAASAGSSNDRFEIVYNSNALNTTTNDWQNQGIRVATKENILIKSSQYNIKAVKVCNVLGQTIKEVKDLDTLQTQLTDVPKNNTVLLLNITLQNNKTAVVKIVY